MSTVPPIQPEAESQESNEPPEMSEGDKIAHLVDLAGFVAHKSQLTDDPRIKVILDVTLKQVQEANVLPSLLMLLHNQKNVKPVATTLSEKRDDERKEWERDMRKTLLGNPERVELKKELENEAIRILIEQIKNQNQNGDTK